MVERESSAPKVHYVMISIKRFLEPSRDGPVSDRSLVEALMQVARLLLDAMASHVVRGTDSDFRSFRRTLSELAHRMAGPQSPVTLIGIASDAAEAMDTYCRRTTAYHREQHEERQSMIAMLTDTLADISGQTDASVARLQAIEKQVELASELDDIRALRASLGESLQALREAAAQQRSNSAATVERLRGQIALARKSMPDDPKHPGDPKDPAGRDGVLDLLPDATDRLGVDSLPASYVAAFKLQRAEHIANRFGETVRRQMLNLIATELKMVLGPNDRLLRWKGASLVMFINSTAAIHEIRSRLAKTVAATSQQYIEVGRSSALLSVGVDWAIFPQADRPLDAVFIEVDAFVANSGLQVRKGN
jgi:GGDEF domain-containing protein